MKLTKRKILQSAPLLLDCQNIRKGTPLYMAPEVVSCGPEQSYSARAADVWSAGIVLYEMLFGRLPFRNLSEAKQCHLQFTGPISDEAKDLLTGILRPQAERLRMCEILQHPWLREYVPLDVFNEDDTEEMVDSELERHLFEQCCNLCPEAGIEDFLEHWAELKQFTPYSTIYRLLKQKLAKRELAKAESQPKTQVDVPKAQEDVPSEKTPQSQNQDQLEVITKSIHDCFDAQLILVNMSKTCYISHSD